MRFTQWMLAALAASTFLTSCGGGLEGDMRKLGAKNCECFKPMSDLQEKVKKNPEDAAKFAGELEKFQAQASECQTTFQKDLEDLKSKYGDAIVNEASAKKAMKAMIAGMRDGGCGAIADEMEKQF